MKTDISFPEVAQAVSRLQLPAFDLVIGIATGGVVPASLVAFHLGCDLRIIRVNYRDDDNNPRHESPVLLSDLNIPEGAHRLLLVDDVSVSGSTMNTVRSLLNGYEINTLVMKGKADYVLFPDVRTCVNWPWKISQDFS